MVTRRAEGRRQTHTSSVFFLLPPVVDDGEEEGEDKDKEQKRRGVAKSSFLATTSPFSCSFSFTFGHRSSSDTIPEEKDNER